MARKLTLDFLKTEAASGAMLGVAALAALIVANSPWSADYFGWLKSEHIVRLGPVMLEMSISEWIKEGLMAVFFLVVGLEIKYEILRGELSDPRWSICWSPVSCPARTPAGPFRWPPTSPSPSPSSAWWPATCPRRCGSSC
jgi:Na+/H+ antiporter NhaA